MKIIGALALGLSFVLVVPAAALEPGLDPQHQVLAGLAGSWSVKQSLWLGDATTPKVDSGEAEFTLVLNRRHLRQSLRIDDGTDFEGLGFMGYDTASRQFFSTWMDVNFPGLVVAYGGLDNVSGAYVLSGSMAAPDGGRVPVREVMTITNADHMRYEFYETRDGKETLAVRLDYTRR